LPFAAAGAAACRLLLAPPLLPRLLTAPPQRAPATLLGASQRTLRTPKIPALRQKRKEGKTRTNS